MGGVIVRHGVLACVLMAAACRGREKLGGDGPYGDKVAAAVPKIEAATGLKFKRPPKLEMRTTAEVRAFLDRTFKEGHALRELQGMEVAYKRFGLLPDTMNLERLMVDLLTEQIVGYYDPKTKVLYVVKEAAPELIGITITHELVHALQDQYVNLDSIQQVARENDRSSAVQAVIEGQAVFEQMSIMLGDNLAAGLPGGWDRVRELIREQSSAMPKFSTAPMIVQETVIFPYLGGAEFVRVFKSKRKGESPLADLPVSTEQVLNPEPFLGAHRDNPVAVRLSAPAGATEVYQNTLGAFETRLFLYQHLRDEPAAVRAAAGWGGDRYQIVRTPAGDGLLWVTVWDSNVEAAEFHDVLERAISRRWELKTHTPITDGKKYSAGARSVYVRALTLQGKPAVIFMDLPDAMDAGVLDLARITIAP